ncbi:MAG: hypothetical protein ABW189_03200 [Rickettsiales bacterium]
MASAEQVTLKDGTTVPKEEYNNVVGKLRGHFAIDRKTSFTLYPGLRILCAQAQVCPHELTRTQASAARQNLRDAGFLMNGHTEISANVKAIVKNVLTVEGETIETKTIHFA